MDGLWVKNTIRRPPWGHLAVRGHANPVESLVCLACVPAAFQSCSLPGLQSSTCLPEDPIAQNQGLTLSGNHFLSSGRPGQPAKFSVAQKSACAAELGACAADYAQKVPVQQNLVPVRQSLVPVQ